MTTQLLIMGAAILAQGPLTVTSDDIQSSDAIYPKHVIAGWQIVDAVLPDGFAPAAYTWDGSAVVARDPDPAVLLKIQVDKWGDIKAERDRRENSGGILVGTDWFQSDADSLIKYLGLKDKGRDVLAAGGTLASPILALGSQVLWSSYANVAVPITVQIAYDMVTAVGDLQGMLFYVAKQHRAAMEASADPAAYDFSAGWPAVYVPAP